MKVEYPAYVKAAVNWWSDALQDAASSGAIQGRPPKRFSEKGIQAFRSTLAKEIKAEMEKYEYQVAFIHVINCIPDDKLTAALKAARVDDNQVTSVFPGSIGMIIDKESVTIRHGYGDKLVAIWGKKPPDLDEY